MLNRAKALAPDALLVAGAASMSYAAWMSYPPAGFFLAGLFAIFAGLKLAKA